MSVRDENRLQLRYKEKNHDDENYTYKYLNLDIIDRIDLNYSSKITEYPMLENDIISDHAYREPGSITIAGTFSTSSRFSKEFEGSGYSRLKYIQKLFEDLKDNRTFFDILSTYNIREKYLLQNISWSEKGNTLDYTFTFKQLYLAKKIDIDVDLDLRDENLPSIEEPETLDFTDEFLDESVILEIVMDVLLELEVIDAEFIKGMAGGVLIVANVVVAASAILAASNPVGWVIGGAVLLGIGISMIVKSAQRFSGKHKIKKFRTHRNKKKNKAEQKRFMEFMENIYEQIEALEEATRVYGLPNNGDQETFLNINGQFYSFLFTRNNTTNSYSLEVTAMDNEIIYSNNNLVGLGTMDQCTEFNNIFKTKNGPQVFIFNKNLMKESIETDGLNPKVSGLPVGQDSETKNIYGDLRDYMILVTRLRLNEWSNILYDIIKNEVIE